MTPRPDSLTPDHRGEHTARLPNYGVPIFMPALPANPARPVVVQPGVAIKDLAPQLGPLWAKYGQEKDG